MVVLHEQFVRAEYRCSICDRQVDPDDVAFCIVRLPSFDAHVVCVADWLIIMSTSYAWLMDEGDTAPDTIRRRIDAAQAMFVGKPDALGHYDDPPPKNGS